MSDQVNTNVEALQSVSQGLGTFTDELTEAINNLKSTMDQAQEAWEDSFAEEVRSEIEEMEQQLDVAERVEALTSRIEQKIEAITAYNEG